MRTSWTLRCFAIAALTTGCPGDDPPSGDETEGVDDDDTTTSTTANPSTSSTTNTEESSSSGEEEESGSSESGAPVDECGAGRVCLGKTPLGWTGPVVVAKGDVAEALPECADPYPGTEITRLEGFAEPGPAECSCECSLSPDACYMYMYSDGPSSSSCSDYYYGYYYYDMQEGCTPLQAPMDNGFLYAYSYPQFGLNSCDQTASEMIPEIPWGAIVKGCTGAATNEECGNDGYSACYNKPAEGYEQQICFIAQGDIPCPPNTDYMEKTIRYSAVEDSRECSTCTCGQLNYCLDEYEYHTTDDCSDAAPDTFPNGSCTGGITAAAVNVDYTGLSCPVQSMAEPEGEANPLDPWTYCCSAPF